METTQVSRLKKNLDSLFSANQIRENKGSANQSKASVRYARWRHMTRQLHRAVESMFRKRQRFLKNCKIFLGISATLTRITKAERFLCFKKKNLNGKNIIK